MMHQRRYWKFMLGAKSANAEQCREEGFIGTDFDIHEDLTGKFPPSRREFVDVWAHRFHKPGVSKIAAGLWASQLWIAGYEFAEGDIILSPTGRPAELYVGEVQGGYSYVPAGPLQHRRSVRWFDKVILRDDLSDPLKASLRYASTLCALDEHAAEISTLLNLGGPSQIGDVGFGMEKYLEEFLIENWSSTDLGKRYDIWTNQDGEIEGQQFLTDNGRMDILAISKDKTELLVVELKRGQASDKVVGQVQRYMGYAVERLAEANQTVRGAIIALGDDLSIKRALLVAPNIDFYKYKVDFKLEKS